MFGFLNINKPTGVNSRYVTTQVQRLLGQGVKVGHAGTLDPIATGVLVLAIGPATRIISHLHRKPKSYIGKFRLGLTSDSQDIEGDVEPVHHATALSQAELLAVFDRFIGKITQVPPKYSAIKIDGKRAYSLARRGKEVIMPERQVDIYGLELREFNYPDFEIEVKCSSGTYIRTLGRDIALACGSDAVMTGLRRTQVGIFDITNSSEIPQLTSRSVAVERIESPTVALRDLSRRVIGEDQVLQLFYGKTIQLDLQAEEAVVTHGGRLIAVVVRTPDGTYKPQTNFIHYWIRNGVYELDSLTQKNVGS